MSKIGIGHNVAISEEATYGTAASTADNFLVAPQEALKNRIEQIEGEGDLAYRQVDGDWVDPGNQMVDGPLSFDLMFGGGWLMLLAHLLGNDVVTAGVGPYTHTLPLGATLGASDDITGRGITVFSDREGQKGAASSRAVRYSGLRPTSFEMAFEQNKRARGSCDLVGRTSSVQARPTPSYPARPFILSPSKASSPTAFLQWNSAAKTTKSATVRFAQPAEPRRALEDAKMLGVLPSDLLEITVEATVEAEDTGAASGGVWYDDYASKAKRPLILTADGPTANSKLVLTLHEAVLMEPGDPEVSGPGLIEQVIRAKGYYDPGNSQIGSLVLTSDDTAAWA